MRFIVDTNVGKLTKWLRILGYDTVFFKGKDDSEIISQALKEDRILLTRDTHLMEWGLIRDGRIRTLLVRSDNPDMQLVQVLEELGIKEFPGPFTVCLECNSSLVEIDRAAAVNSVPPYVFRTQRDFKVCPKCQRTYWRGTHWEIMKKRIGDLVRDI
jgi:hypothetical protein